VHAIRLYTVPPLSHSVDRHGQKICLFQASPESPAIFALLRIALDGGYAHAAAAATAAGISSGDWALFAAYAACFVDSSGNYKSFGDSKFVPSLTPDAFHAVLSSTPGYAAHTAVAEELWAAVRGPLFDLSPRARQLGLAPSGAYVERWRATIPS